MDDVASEDDWRRAGLPADAAGLAKVPELAARKGEAGEAGSGRMCTTVGGCLLSLASSVQESAAVRPLRVSSVGR